MRAIGAGGVWGGWDRGVGSVLVRSHATLVITVFLSRHLPALYACAMSPIQSSGFFSKLASMFKAFGFPGSRTGSPEVTAGLAALSLPVSCTSC